MIESVPVFRIQVFNSFLATIFVYYGILNGVATVINYWAEGKEWLKYAIDIQATKIKEKGIDSYTKE